MTFKGNVHMESPRAFRASIRGIAFVAAALAGGVGGNLWCGTAYAQLYPMTTFGSNGWVAPSTQPVLATTNANRGMAWNPVTKNLVVPANIGGNPVTIFNGTTGAVVKTMNSTGLTGGAVATGQVGVTDDGQIFVSNIQNSSSLLSFYKVYGWPSESTTAPPNVSLNMNIPVSTSGQIRLGDAFAVTGTGNNVRFATAGSTTSGSTGGVANNSGFFTGIIDTSSTNSGVYTAFLGIPATNTANNDYRLSVTFIDGDTLIGNQGTSAKITDFVVSGTGVTGSGATVTAAIPLGAAQRAMDYTIIGGKPYLAVMDTNSSAVSVFDITNPATPALYGSAFTTIVGASVGNTNASGQVAWGDVTDLGGGFFQAQLYALNTNNGIQAMNFVVPEPSTWAMLAMAVATGGMVSLRRRMWRHGRFA